MKARRKLHNMEIEEVSLVDSPANMKNFLFYKQEKGDNKMNEKIREILKAFFGEDRQIQKMEKDDERATAVEKAVEAIKNYREDMPEELEKAIGSLVECGLQGLVKEEEKEEVDKDKAEKNTKTDDKQDDNISEVTKALEEIKTQMKTANDANGKISESVEALGERISKLEKQDANSQVLKGQEGGSSNDEDLFPSLNI